MEPRRSGSDAQHGQRARERAPRGIYGEGEPASHERAYLTIESSCRQAIGLYRSSSSAAPSGGTAKRVNQRRPASRALMTRSLTLLQRVVLQRLRERNLHDAADASRAAWSEGRIAQAPTEI